MQFLQCAPCVPRVCSVCASSVLRACSVWAPLAQASERSLNHREALANVTRFAMTVFVPLGAMAVAWEMNKHNLRSKWRSNGEHQPGLRVRLASQFPNLVDASQLGGKPWDVNPILGVAEPPLSAMGLLRLTGWGDASSTLYSKKQRCAREKQNEKMAYEGGWG